MGAIIASYGFTPLAKQGENGVQLVLGIFSGIMFLGLVCTWFIPETKGRTLEDLSNDNSSSSKSKKYTFKEEEDSSEYPNHEIDIESDKKMEMEMEKKEKEKEKEKEIMEEPQRGVAIGDGTSGSSDTSDLSSNVDEE